MADQSFTEVQYSLSVEVFAILAHFEINVNIIYRGSFELVFSSEDGIRMFI
jgi:hypothetical protein